MKNSNKGDSYSINNALCYHSATSSVRTSRDWRAMNPLSDWMLREPKNSSTGTVASISLLTQLRNS